MTLASGTRLGPYEIVAELGAGGMGEVYRARDVQLKRDVALKVLPAAVATDPDRLARFQREAELLAALNHSHIAQIYGLVEAELTTGSGHGGVRALAMELVEGETLAERIARGPMLLDEVLPIARQFAEALEYAHERGIVHRDLKPANIKLTPDGAVKVLDFGLAKALAADSGGARADLLGNSPTMTSPAMTQAGVILGTAAYMSPEQARGAAIDKRADIWAFGVVLFEMLTGRPCFAGDSVTDVLAAVIRAEPPWAHLPAGTPPRVQELLERCLAKDRRQRLRDIGDARLELEKVVAAGPESAAPESHAPSPSLSPRRRWLPWALTAASLLALGIVAVAWLWVGGPGRQTATEQPTYSSLLPPADSVSCFRDGFAVSPDGRKIAFSSLSSKGERLVWVRDLGRAEPVPLPGTNGALYPFWSPDSRSIGFYANGWLKRISLEGGPTQALCRASMVGSPASWGRAGTIIFYDGTALSSVSEGGGEPERIPAPWGLAPSFLDDGNRFVFATQLSTRLAFSSTLGQPDRQVMIRGVTDVGGIQWAGTDVFMLHHSKDRTVVAQHVDLNKSEVVGIPTLMAEGVPSPNAVPSFSVSPSGVAAYVVNPPEARNDFPSRLTWVDRQGRVVGTLGETGGYWSARISHDGLRVAVNPDDDAWIYEIGTGNRTRLTREMDSGGWAYLPVWSPRDDELLAGVITRGGAPALRAYPVSGGQARDVDVRTDYFGATDWSRDGRYVMFGRFEKNSDMADLAYYDFKDGQVRSFLSTAAYESHGVLSPDGRWISYVSNATGALEVYVQPFPGGGKETRVSFTGGMHPRWRADGKELFFLTSDWTVMAAEVRLQPFLEIRTPVRLFSMVMADIIHGMVAPYDASPDGKKFLVIVPAQSAPVPLTLIENWTALTRR